MLKRCTKCASDLPEDAFYLVTRRGKPYRMAECRDCVKARVRARNQTEPAKTARRQWAQAYRAKTAKPRKTTPIAERFWAKVRKSDGCWEWTASLNSMGYGQLNPGRHSAKPLTAHRFSWELHNGPITGGLHVCHKCDNPKCVRPDHLFLGTATDNLRDMAAKGRSARWQSRKTHCAHGHPFDEANTIWRRTGGRKCRACNRKNHQRSAAIASPTVRTNTYFLDEGETKKVGTG